MGTRGVVLESIKNEAGRCVPHCHMLVTGSLLEVALIGLFRPSRDGRDVLPGGRTSLSLSGLWAVAGALRHGSWARSRALLRGSTVLQDGWIALGLFADYVVKLGADSLEFILRRWRMRSQFAAKLRFRCIASPSVRIPASPRYQSMLPSTSGSNFVLSMSTPPLSRILTTGNAFEWCSS